MKIKELSMQTGASLRSLRYYESKNLLVVRRLENSYREYDDSAVERVKNIQLYLSLGLTTDEIAEIIECPVGIDRGRPLCRAVYALYQAKLAAITRQITLLQQVQQELRTCIQDFVEAEGEIR